VINSVAAAVPLPLLPVLWLLLVRQGS